MADIDPQEAVKNIAEGGYGWVTILARLMLADDPENVDTSDISGEELERTREDDPTADIDPEEAIERCAERDNWLGTLCRLMLADDPSEVPKNGN